MDYSKYENFIFNKGRDLEVSLFNYYFLNDEIDNCLLALSLYINEDGGISNIDPDNLNNISTLSASIYFLNIVWAINYKNDQEYFNEIIQDIVKYLKKQKDFTYYHKSNEKKACSNKYKENVYKFELEAITYGFIYYYTKDELYLEKLNILIEKYLNLNNPNFNEVYYFKIIESLFNNEKLKNKIISDLNNLEESLELHKLIFSKDDYLINNTVINNHKTYLLNNKNSIGIWERKSNWDSSYPEGEVADIKYLSITLIEVLKFLENVGECNDI